MLWRKGSCLNKQRNSEAGTRTSISEAQGVNFLATTLSFNYKAFYSGEWDLK